MDYKTNWKKTVKGIIIGFLLLVFMRLVLNYLSLGVVGIFYFLLGVNVAFTLLFGKWSWKKFFINAFGLAVFLIIMRVLAQVSGVWGVILVNVGIIGYFFYTRWPQYLDAKHKCEAAIWGKPLYKFKEEGKPRPKIKFKI